MDTSTESPSPMSPGTPSTYPKSTTELKSCLIYAENYSLPRLTDSMAGIGKMPQLKSRQVSFAPSEDQEKYAYKWEANTYEYTFNITLFGQAFVLYMLYLFGLGPPLMLFNHYLKWPFLHNLISIINVSNMAMLPISFFHFIFAILNPHYFRVYIFESFVTITFMAFFYASLVAHSNRNFPELLKLTILSSNSLHKATTFKAVAKKELQDTIQRLKINASSFYFNFIKEHPSRFRRLSKKNLYFHHDNSDLQETEEEISQEAFVNKSLLQNIMDFEKKLFIKKFLQRETKYDSQYLSGYCLAYQLVKETHHSLSGSGRAFLIILSLIKGTVMTVFTYTNAISGTPIRYFWIDNLEIIISIFVLVLNSVYTYLMLEICYSSVLNLKDRGAFMGRLGDLLTQKNRKVSNDANCYPQINIFDFMSLKTWTDLRKIFMNFNEQRMKTTNFVVTLLMSSHLLIAIVFFFNMYLNFLDFHFIENLLLFFLCFMMKSVVYFVFLAWILILGATLNSQYKAHKELIHINRSTVISLFGLYQSYIEDQSIEPATYTEAEGLKLLREEFGEKFLMGAMNHKLNLLMKTYDEVLKEIDHDETYNPFKIMGMPITWNFIKTLISVLSMVALPLYQKMKSLAK